MIRALWKALARPSVCGAALLSLANWVGAQEVRIPTVQPPTSSGQVLPALLPSAPTRAPILPVQGKEPSVPMTPDAAPRSILVAAPNLPAPQADDVKARIERLEKQNQELLDALRGLKQQPQPLPTAAPVQAPAQGGGLNTTDVQKIVGDYLAAKAAKDKVSADAAKAEEQARGFIVTKQLDVTGRFTQGGVGSGNSQMWFETRDKAFRMHFGGRVQPSVIFGADTRNDAGNNVEQGKGGTGPFLEGFNFRRARLEADGWLYDNVDFFVEFDWANTPFNTGVKGGNLTAAGTPTGTQPFTNILNPPAPTDVWGGINNLPLGPLQMVRFGNLKPVIGLDHLTSSRYLDFLERSIGFDQYYNRNNGFEPGFMFAGNSKDERMTWALTITRTCNGPFGFDQGGGAWDYTGRVTWLPYYEADGRCMVHLGLGAKYQRLDSSTGVPVANLQERWLLRNSQSGLQNVVAFSTLTGIDQEIIQPELFINLGPLSIQAEYLGSRVNGVTSYQTQLTPAAVAIPSTTFYSQTAYVQAMYFLTGEHRPYGKTYTHSSGPAPTRVVPHRNFFWVPGQGPNGNPFSLGAWQVGARYCYSTLNSGPINAGIVHECTVGINWFLNPNIRFQWNYDVGHRDLASGGGTSNGYFQGVGMQMCLDW